jgi:anti-sigma factor RsiW
VSEHFTVDELAELDAGLLARRRAAAATRHLAECEECTARVEALKKTQDSLRGLGPVDMPADVVARLTRALSEATATSGSDVVPDLGERRSRRGGGIPKWAYAAAAAVVVLGGTGITIGALHHGKPTVSDAAVPLVATSVPPSELIQVETGRTYTPDSISEYANGLLGGPVAADSLAAPQTAAGTQPGTTSNVGGGAATGGAPDTTPRKYATTSKAPSGGAAAPEPLSPESAGGIPASLQHLAGDRSALLQCAAYITDTPNASPLVVDFGRWTNAAAGIHKVPSVVFVFADTDDDTTVDVYVVAAACDASSLLDFQVLQKTG